MVNFRLINGIWNRIILCSLIFRLIYGIWNIIILCSFQRQIPDNQIRNLKIPVISIGFIVFSHNFPYLWDRTTSWDIFMFDTCKLKCDVTLQDIANLFLDLSVTAERTHSWFIENKRFGYHVRKKNLTLVVSWDQQFLKSFKKCYLARQWLAK